MQELIMQEVTGFATVLITAVVVAGAIATLYSCGLRLWEKGTDGGSAVLRAVSVVCFAACVAIVLFALWLMIPIFH